MVMQEMWGVAINTEEVLLASPPLTYCCVAPFLTGLGTPALIHFSFILTFGVVQLLFFFSFCKCLSSFLNTVLIMSVIICWPNSL